LRYDQKL